MRVLELATGVAGPFAGKLLADFGADVVKVEPPGGDESRSHGPFPEALELRSAHDPERRENSALFLHLNANKRSIVLDLDRVDDQDLVRRLAVDSDVIIESCPPGFLASRGLDYSQLAQLNPDVVLVSVTPFGQDGPYAPICGRGHRHLRDGRTHVLHRRGDHGTGEVGRQPDHLPVRQPGCHRRVGRAHHGRAVGEPVHIDLSMFEAQAGSVDRRVSYLLWYLWSGLVVGRQPMDSLRALPNGFFETADGYVLAFTLPMWIERMLNVLDDEGLRERFKDPNWMRDDDLVDEIQALFVPWLYSGDNADRAREAQRHKWAVTPLNAPVDLVDDAHFVARGFLAEVDHPVAGSGPPAGRPVPPGRRRRTPRCSFIGLPRRWDSTTPRSGPSWDRRLASPSGVGAADRPSGHSSGAARYRSPACAGARHDRGVGRPLATMFLADLGAEVIRVDNPYVWPTATRGDGPRPAAAQVPTAGPLRSYPNDDPGDRPWNRHSMYSAHARNKLGATLDLRTDLGRETFLRLVERSDVLVENNSVGVLDKLGIGWDVLHARNPRLVCVRMPPMGLDGPYAQWLGFGAHFEALCGLTALRGYPDLDPSVIAPRVPHGPRHRGDRRVRHPRRPARAGTDRGGDAGRAVPGREHDAAHRRVPDRRRSHRPPPRADGEPVDQPGAAGLLPLRRRGPLGGDLRRRRRRVGGPGAGHGVDPPGQPRTASPPCPAGAPITTTWTG